MAKLKITVNQGCNHIVLFFHDFCGACEYMDKTLQSGKGISFHVEPEGQEKAPEEDGANGEEEMMEFTDFE